MANSNKKLNTLIKKFNINLSDHDFYKKMAEELNDFIIQGDEKGAYKLAAVIKHFLEKEKNFEKNQPGLHGDYQRLINTAKWVCLSWFPLAEVIRLFEENLAEGLAEPDIGIWDKVRSFLVSSILLKDRDKTKRQLREAMLRNNQIITASDVVIDEKSESGTIHNWLSDYNKNLGAAPLEKKNIDLYQYVIKDKNVKKVTPEQKKQLIVLFDLYERLKLSSSTIEGFEGSLGVSDEKAGKFGVISDGEVTIVDRKIVESIRQAQDILDVALGRKPASILKKVDMSAPMTPESLVTKQQSKVEKEVLKAYQGDPRQQKAIAKAEARLNKSFPDDNAKIRTEFFVAVQKKNVNIAIAALRILSERQDLEDFIKTDAKLAKFLTVIWQKRYGQDFVDEFEKNPAQLKFIRLFLRYVLEERLGMSSSDAARVGLQIGNIFVNLGKKGYNKMAYFDVKDNSFKWFD